MGSTAGPILGRLFEGRPVIVDEMRLSDAVPSPHPLEAEQVANAVVKRRIEFAAGRCCARRALRRLNVEDFVLRNGTDRVPCWPTGVVGSIAHTGDAVLGGCCGVVVGRVDQVVTVGLDIEGAKPLDVSVWSHVLTVTECRSLEGFDAITGGLLAKLIFSAKECFYKAQFLLSRRFLGFQDVEIALDLELSIFEARLTMGAPAHLPLSECGGRFVRSDEFVAAGIALLA